MTATYLRHGRGESLRSLRAKSEGIYPKTLFCNHYGITPKMWKILIDLGLSPNEKHHTGKYANLTDFYSPQDAKDIWIEHLKHIQMPYPLTLIKSSYYLYYKNKKNTVFYNYNKKPENKKQHRSLKQNIKRAAHSGNWQLFAKLIPKFNGKYYISMNIETGEYSMQFNENNYNWDAKERFFPRSCYLMQYINIKKQSKQVA